MSEGGFVGAKKHKMVEFIEDIVGRMLDIFNYLNFTDVDIINIAEDNHVRGMIYNLCVAYDQDTKNIATGARRRIVGGITQKSNPSLTLPDEIEDNIRSFLPKSNKSSGSK